MQAWKVGGVGDPAQVIELVECPVPEPGIGQVQIKVNAAGMGLPDVLMCRGEYAFSPELPFTPGQEVAGVITALGEGATAQIGQRVMAVTAFYAGHGSYAEYCLAPDHALYPIPDTMSDTDAAAFCIPYHTAIVGLKDRANMQPGETLLIHGAAGGSGSAAIQLGKAMGATVIATAGSEDKLAYCRTLGADLAVNYREDDFATAVLEVTEGKGADVVYDPVGGEIFEHSLSCMASGGRLLAIGFASGSWGKAETADLVRKNCSSMGVYVGAYNHEQMLPMHAELMGHCAAGRIASQVDVVAPFEGVSDYLERLKRREVNGKVVVSLT
jgi:NADPH2:quinone reductase